MITHPDPADLIDQAVQISGQKGYTGTFRELGGGEVNDTYALDFTDGRQLILRLARYEGQRTLRQEAEVLPLLAHVDHVPKTVFFDEESRLAGRMWILETRVPGQRVDRLSATRYTSLGKLLARVHEVKGEGHTTGMWEFFLWASKAFGDEGFLLAHPDGRLRKLILVARNYFEVHRQLLKSVKPSLVHGDATPSNVLADGDDIGLIDWEFSRFNDSMYDFSTVFYEDMEYNKGKWRVHITPEGREALFVGYEQAGGKIDTERLRLWMIVDKLGAAIFLYWRLYQSGRDATPDQMAQYRLDLNNLLASLEGSLPEAKP